MVCIDGGISFLVLVILLFPVLSLALYVVIHLQPCVGDRWLAVETVTSKHLSPLSKTSYGPFYLFVLHLLFSFFSSSANSISEVRKYFNFVDTGLHLRWFFGTSIGISSNFSILCSVTLISLPAYTTYVSSPLGCTSSGVVYYLPSYPWSVLLWCSSVSAHRPVRTPT